MSAETKLAIILLLLAFVFKLAMGRETKLAHVVEGILELPIDVAFVAISIALSGLVLDPSLEARQGTAIMLTFLLLASAITVLIARLARTASDTGKIFPAWLLGAIAHAISIVLLFWATSSIPDFRQNFKVGDDTSKNAVAGHQEVTK